MLIKVADNHFQEYSNDKVIYVKFDIHYASTNIYKTKRFWKSNPVVVDNKNDIDNIILKSYKFWFNWILHAAKKESRMEVYIFLDVKYHVYEINTPIGKANKLPIHFQIKLH